MINKRICRDPVTKNLEMKIELFLLVDNVTQLVSFSGNVKLFSMKIVNCQNNKQ